MQALYNRLGNQALLAGSVNSKLGNIGFAPKQKALSESPFSLTQLIAEFPDWSEKEISERQDILAGYAMKAWPLLV